MSHYLQQEYDFVFRTREILKQYDLYFQGKDTKEKYEATLLLNSIIGLLIVPKEHWFENLPDDKEINEKENWGINTGDITFIKEGEKKTLKAVVTHLRNSVSHYRFKVNGNDEIENITFQDYIKKDGPKTFEMKISIKSLSFFLDKFSLWFLEEMNKQK